MHQRLKTFAGLTVLCLLLVLLGQAVVQRSPISIGFFSADGVSPDFISRVAFSKVNLSTPEKLRQDFAFAAGSSHKIDVDLGGVIASIRDSKTLSRHYVVDREQRMKLFEPQSKHKVLFVPRREELRERLASFLPIMLANAGNLGAVYLVDEPYLHGISKQELERIAADVRVIFKEAGLERIRLGVIFASGMFDRDFARHINSGVSNYARAIDDHYASHKYLENQDTPEGTAFKSWVEAIRSHRLTTYDQAGNLFVDGGIPRGFDVVGFDFYISTLLLDATHGGTMDWLATRFPDGPCRQFKGQSMRQIRGQLSFFGKEQEGDEKAQASDRRLLDALFACRMPAMLQLLRDHITASGLKDVNILLIGESSNNGLLAFDEHGVPKRAQVAEIVEARVLDEVTRYARLYAASPNQFKGGLSYFTFNNTFDKTISLGVGGASGMPTVMRFIYSAASGSHSRQ